MCVFPQTAIVKKRNIRKPRRILRLPSSFAESDRLQTETAPDQTICNEIKSYLISGEKSNVQA